MKITYTDGDLVLRIPLGKAASLEDSPLVKDLLLGKITARLQEIEDEIHAAQKADIDKLEHRNDSTYGELKVPTLYEIHEATREGRKVFFDEKILPFLQAQDEKTLAQLYIYLVTVEDTIAPFGELCAQMAAENDPQALQRKMIATLNDMDPNQVMHALLSGKKPE